MKLINRVAVCVFLVVATLTQAPHAAAAGMLTGNYEMRISGRYDFHTWLWAVAACPTAGDCVHVVSIPQPIAKAYTSRVNAPLRAGTYTMVVDDPFGLRCDNIYYGRTIATRDTYAWDAVTLTGTMTSEYPVGCNGEPAGRYLYPFTLVRM